MNDTLDLFAAPVSPELAAKHIQTVSLHHSKNIKLAWNRKIKKMHSLIDDLSVYEKQILAITQQKQPILDEIAYLRNEMNKECIHPKDHLAHLGTYLLCKFCDKKLSIPRIISDQPVVDDEDETASDDE